MYSLEDYNYQLPPELIAQEPLQERDKSRLMLLDRKKGEIHHSLFYELPNLLGQEHVLVVNNSRVLPARLYGTRKTGGRVELLVIEAQGEKTKCLVKLRGKLKHGEYIHFGGEDRARFLGQGEDGIYIFQFATQSGLDELLEKKGLMPLPPYIKRPPTERDKERYQTIFSKAPGSVAAPTAGLHFSRELITRLNKRGVRILEITLHVGYGTFRPVKARDIRQHRVMPERYNIPEEVAKELNEAMAAGKRILAVGTTVVRALESAAEKEGSIRPGSGVADLTILPGYEFKVIQGLITNFHLPKSSLLMLVSAFAGYELTMEAYRSAVEHRYRFYSYGDAMLIHQGEICHTPSS